jgi:hypothetical protein
MLACVFIMILVFDFLTNKSIFGSAGSKPGSAAGLLPERPTIFRLGVSIVLDRRVLAEIPATLPMLTHRYSLGI